MSLNLLFCHGWGFDAGFWTPLTTLLPEFGHVRDDAGYFISNGSDAKLLLCPATPHTIPAPPSPYIAITHSYGTMRLLAAPPPGIVGLVAITGFDRFTQADGFPGTPRRVVDRMVSAVAQVPETVLADFHTMLGSTVPSGTPQTERLQTDLVGLRDGDMREAAAQLDVPILSLQAEKDVLLPVSMRETVFATVGGVMRHTHPSAGHLLPREDAHWCAEAIRHFANSLHIMDGLG